MLKNLRRKGKNLKDRVDHMCKEGDINIRSLSDIKEFVQQIDKLKQDLLDKQVEIDIYKALFTKVNSEKDSLKKTVKEIRAIIGS